MNISGVNSLLGMQQDLATSQTQKSGQDFKDLFNQALNSGEDEGLKEACNQIESYMLSMVFKQMKESMLQNDDENALIPEGDYTKTFQETMINTLADNMVEAGGIGLSEQLYKQIKSTYAAQMQVSQENETAALSAVTQIDSEI